MKRSKNNSETVKSESNTRRKTALRPDEVKIKTHWAYTFCVFAFIYCWIVTIPFILPLNLAFYNTLLMGVLLLLYVTQYCK